MSYWLDFWAFTVLAWVQSLVGKDPTSCEVWSKKKKKSKRPTSFRSQTCMVHAGTVAFLFEVGMKNNLKVYCNSHSKLSALSKREKDQEAESERLIKQTSLTLSEKKSRKEREG